MGYRGARCIDFRCVSAACSWIANLCRRAQLPPSDGSASGATPAVLNLGAVNLAQVSRDADALQQSFRYGFAAEADGDIVMEDDDGGREEDEDEDEEDGDDDEDNC